MIELDRFSEAARRAVTFANYEARYVVTGALEPGHLLFGVVQEAPEWTGTLSRGRLTPQGLRQRLKQEFSGRLQPGPWESEELKLSPEAQNVLAEAERQAAQRGQATVDLAHLLLALLATQDSVAARLLAGAGVTREALLATLPGGVTGGTPSATLNR